MPRLKELSCSIEWSDTRAPFQEYGTIYGDSVVETYITVPNKPQAFTIHLRSHAFIYEGLSAVVFIDGKYQANRNRVNLQPAGEGTDQTCAVVSFLMRQKEKPVGDGMYLGREWRFDDHNITLDVPADIQTDHFNDLGTIEVLVLRCRSQSYQDSPASPCSSAADSDIFCERQDQRKLDNANLHSEISSKTPLSPQILAFSGFSGLFDGSNDFYDPHKGQNGQYLAPQTLSSRHPYRPVSLPHTDYGTHATPHQPKPKKHVHFDFGPHGPPPSVHAPREDPIGPRPGSYNRYRPRPDHSTSTINFHTATNHFPQHDRAHSFSLPQTTRASHVELDRNAYHPSEDVSTQTQAPNNLPFYASFPGSHAYPYAPGYPHHLYFRHPSYVPLWHNPQYPQPDSTAHHWGPLGPFPHATYGGFHNAHMPYYGYTHFPGPSRFEQPNGFGHVVPGSDSPKSGDTTQTVDQQGQSLHDIADGAQHNSKVGTSTDFDWQQSQPRSEGDTNNIGNDTNWTSNDDPNTTQEKTNAGINWDSNQNTNGENTWNTDNMNDSVAAAGFQDPNENNEFAVPDQNTTSEGKSNAWDNNHVSRSDPLCTRALHGPHGEYYTWDPRGEQEPFPDAEEEPRYDVPKTIAELRGSTKQVQPGKGYIYYKRGQSVEYLDKMEEPYARFVFKYRTKDQLAREIGVHIDTDPSGDLATQELQSMDKQALIESLLRAKSALGGKIPSPPLLSDSSVACKNSSIKMPVPIDAPTYAFLRYSLPPARNPSGHVQLERVTMNNDWQQNHTFDTQNNYTAQPDTAQDWSNPQESNLCPGITHIDTRSSNPNMVGDGSKTSEQPDSEQRVSGHASKVQGARSHQTELNPFTNVPSMESSPVENIPSLSRRQYQSSPSGQGDVSNQEQAPIAPATPKNDFW